MATCLVWQVSVMALAIIGLGYIAAATYLWLRNTNPAHPVHLLLVFGIAVVADFFMVATLSFVGISYCRNRNAFKEADEANQYARPSTRA